ncbi:hypothetical protein MTO96_025297 [Rhipicephalus appendiculatus]
MSSTRKKSKDSGRRRASLAGDVRDKERALVASASVGRIGEYEDSPSAVSKRASAEKPGTQRERKNRGRRRSRRNSAAPSVPSVASDGGTNAASDAEPGGTTQRSETEVAGSVEQTGLRKCTSVTEDSTAMEQPGSAKEPGETQHADAMEHPGEVEPGSLMEQPAQTQHALPMEQPGTTAPTGSTFQPATSQHADAMAETGNTELPVSSPQSGLTGPLAKSHSRRRGSLKARDSFVTTTTQALSTLLCTHSPSASTDHPSRKVPAEWRTEALKSKVAATMLLVVAILAFAFLLRISASTGNKRRTYCTTTGCLTHKALIEEQLDRGVDPCDDFYAYVCNRWKPKKEFSDLSHSALSDMVMSWLSDLPTTLSKGMTFLPVGRKAAAMFNSCMTETGSHVNILKNFMNAHGLVWPEKPDEHSLPANALFDLSFNWNVNLWFALNVLPGVEQSARRRIFMKPNNLMPLWKSSA